MPAPTPEPAPASKSAPEPDNKDAVIAELQMSLNAMRQEAQMNKLNTLAKEGRLTKPAFDKAKAMHGGNFGERIVAFDESRFFSFISP